MEAWAMRQGLSSKNTPSLPRRWYSVAEAASYFGLKSPKTLYTLAARDRLPAGAVLRIGRQIRVNVEVIEAAAKGEKK